MSRTKRIFIAATEQDDGKTTTVLGFLQHLREKYSSVGFIKPVGQRYVKLKDGTCVDKDVWLIKEAFDLEEAGEDMSPIVIPSGFTKKYIDSRNPIELEKKLLDAWERIAFQKETVVIEGTGHAGVGSVFDMSNARVASLLDAPVVLISGGGIGRPIDRLILNAALFRAHNVPVKGAFINKILPNKCEQIFSYAQRALAWYDIPLLGVLPYTPLLSQPTLRETAKCVHGEFLCGNENDHRLLRDVELACLYNSDVLTRLQCGTLLVTTAEATEMLIACAGEGEPPHLAQGTIAAVLLVEGYIPKHHIIRMLERADIPVIITDMSAYDATRAVSQMVAKTQPDNPEKMAEIYRIFAENIDIEFCVRTLWNVE